MSSLVNVNVRIFCQGGWEVSGLVKQEFQDKLLIENENSFIVFKNSIAVLEILKTKPQKKTRITEPRETSEEFPQNGLSYGEQYHGIPKSLLKKEYTENDDDFSIRFSNDNNSGLKFGVKDESKTNKDAGEY